MSTWKTLRDLSSKVICEECMYSMKNGLNILLVFKMSSKEAVKQNTCTIINKITAQLLFFIINRYFSCRNSIKPLFREW